MSDPTLGDALNGILTAGIYCESVGLDDHAESLGDLYQQVSQESPEQTWEPVTDEELRLLLESVDADPGD